MASCWTCGSSAAAPTFRCGNCSGLDVMDGMGDVSSALAGQEVATGLRRLEKLQQENYARLQASMTKGFSQLATMMEWGFEELTWGIQSQTEVLRSIDDTLRTPSETQANEYRGMAEELARRDVDHEAEEFYRKALDLNRLDFRTYIGLAKVLLRRNQFPEAREILICSLPHAPKQDPSLIDVTAESGISDWRSYPLRLIGHIDACTGDYVSASQQVQKAVELSPNYSDAWYDNSQYYGLRSDEINAASSLEAAIRLKPVIWQLALRQRAFQSVQNEIKEMLIRLREEGKQAARETLNDTLELVVATGYGIDEEINESLSLMDEIWKNARRKEVQSSIDRLQALRQEVDQLRDEIASLTVPDVYTELVDLVRNIPSRFQSELQSLSEQTSAEQTFRRQAEETLRFDKSNWRKGFAVGVLLLLLALTGGGACVAVFLDGDSEAPTSTRMAAGEDPPHDTSPTSEPKPERESSSVKKPQPNQELDPMGEPKPEPEKSSPTRIDLGGGEQIELVHLPAGTFTMGSPDSDEMADSDEKPQRTISLERFEIGKTEVTVGQWKRFVVETSYQTESEKAEKSVTWKSPGFAQTDKHPVVCVSWNDAVAFCEWLSMKSGDEVGLPTEAQWEYACRAGTQTRYFTGDDPASLNGYANVYGSVKGDNGGFSFNDGHQYTSEVGSFRANPWGLYDMTGNVWEWCQDRYSSNAYKMDFRSQPNGPSGSTDRVYRGGSWFGSPRKSRSAFRYSYAPSSWERDRGFRVTRVSSGE